MRIGLLAAPNEDGSPRYETLRLVEEIIEAGHQPRVIDYTGLSVGSGPDRMYTFFEDRKAADVDIVVPYCDTNVLAGERALRALMHNRVPSTVQPEKIDQARNKILAQMAFAEAGVAHPRSIAPASCSLSENLEAIIEKVEMDPEKPVVTKLLFGTEGRDVWLNHREITLLRTTRLIAMDEQFMFQEYIPPPDGSAQASDKGILVCNGEVVTAFKRTAKEGDFRANLAQGGTGELYEPSDEEAAMALGVSGALDIPFGRLDILDSAEGPQAVEFNVFPGFKIEKITGVNVAKLCVKHAVGQAGA